MLSLALRKKKETLIDEQKDDYEQKAYNFKGDLLCSFLKDVK